MAAGITEGGASVAKNAACVLRCSYDGGALDGKKNIQTTRRLIIVTHLLTLKAELKNF